jgi:putative phosphoribosyl transferase
VERRFRDRHEAGRLLAEGLLRRVAARAMEEGAEAPLVLGIPRGGVVVADEVARALEAPLDVVVAGRIRAPFLPEVTIGALTAEGPGVILEQDLADALGATSEYVEAAVRQARAETARRVSLYRGQAPPPLVTGRTVILIDDGIASGATFRAALATLRAARPRRLIAAAPVASEESILALHEMADDVVCLATPEPFLAVGVWYESFAATSDDEVTAILSAHGLVGAPNGSDAEIVPGDTGRPIEIPIGSASLPGYLAAPQEPRGVVVFAHGSGSGRNSVRNAFLAQRFQEAGLATLLFDLLTAEETEVEQNRFDASLQSDRLIRATEWLRKQPETRELPIAYLGASTGAAAALVAAARAPGQVRVVVSRGGRPDLAGEALDQVRVPTRLIVGAEDPATLRVNRLALDRLQCVRDLTIVPGAGHLFEEAGTLEEAARLCIEWLDRHL